MRPKLRAGTRFAAAAAISGATLLVGCASGANAGETASSSASAQGGRGRAPAELFTGRRNVAERFEPGDALRIVAHEGEVRLRSADRETLSVSAVLRLSSQERLNASQAVVERLGGETLVRAAWPAGGPQGAESSSFQIESPRTARGVRVTTGRAPVLIEDMAGDCVARAAGGSIVVRAQQGAVEAETENARIEIEGASGDVRATTRNAPVRVLDARAGVRIGVERGAALVSLAEEWQGPLEIFVTGGEAVVELRPSTAATLELRSDRGLYEVALPEDAAHIERRGDGSWIVRVNGGGDGRASVVESIGGAVRLVLRER